MAILISLSGAVYAQERAARSETDAGRAGVDEKSPKSDEKLFSGPQAGEPLPELPLWIVSKEEKPSEKVDVSEVGKKHPLAIVFMHERSRPGFGLARLMSEFAARRTEENLQMYVVVLTNDRSSSEQWLRQIRRYFPESTHLAVADGGIEGPGALGLNRLVALTVLVAKDSKVTANFAITQVSIPTDGPPILQAMNTACGGKAIPPLDELLPAPNRKNAG